jgi:hypothetical protein
MSRTWEYYYHAAHHHERAAYHYKEAAKYEKAGEHEKAAHHAYLAHGYTQHAIDCDAEAAKLHADHFLHVEHCESSVSIAYKLGATKKSAASERNQEKECRFLKEA